jgi:hypothetical protein
LQPATFVQDAPVFPVDGASVDITSASSVQRISEENDMTAVRMSISCASLLLTFIVRLLWHTVPCNYLRHNQNAINIMNLARRRRVEQTAKKYVAEHQVRLCVECLFSLEDRSFVEGSCSRGLTP